MVSFTHGQNIIATKHSWTTLRMSRPLFAVSYLQVKCELSVNEKEERFASDDNLILPPCGQ